MLALLALALFPVTAHAQNPGEAVYEMELPTVHSEPAPGSGSGTESHDGKSSNNGQSETGRATGSNAATGGTGTEGSEKESGSGHKGSSKEGSSSEGEGNPATAGGGPGDTSGGGPGGGAESAIGDQQSLGGTQTGANASHGSGGSSPVVPILIAVVVLAAISIGAVLYRQRRSGPGGSDGRVSSPNAS